MAFYRLTVTNTGKNTAHDCAIHINFRTSKNRPLFSLVGKWDSLPEPLGPMSQNQQVQVWPSIIPLSEKQSIRHRQSDTFCLAIKDNTFFCYAFNAQSYLHPKFQNPLWQLQTGNYFVEIELIADNAQKKCDFKLSNKGNTIYDLYLSSLKA
jgi:hypothetical protein